MKKIALYLAGASVVAVVVAACGGSNSTAQEPDTGTVTTTASPTAGEATPEPTETTAPEGTDATTAPAATGASITIADISYGQQPITVSPGEQITITNNDPFEHSVTSDTDGQFSVDVDGGEQGMLTAPTEPGEYAFHCKYHPEMHGTLVVQ